MAAPHACPFVKAVVGGMLAPPPYCVGLQHVSAGAMIEDGSAVGEAYRNESECYFIVHGEANKGIKLEFVRFDLEDTFDMVSVSV